MVKKKEGEKRIQREVNRRIALQPSPWLCSPGPIKCKAGTGAQVILNCRQGLAGITRSYSFKRRCLGDEGLIGSVESPLWFCSASRAQDERRKEGRLGAWTSQSMFKKHLCPIEWPQKTAWMIRGCSSLSVCRLPAPWFLCVEPALLPQRKIPSCLLFRLTIFSHFPFISPAFLCSVQLYSFSPLHILFSGFPGCKWQTSRDVKASKKPGCNYWAISP